MWVRCTSVRALLALRRDPRPSISCCDLRSSSVVENRTPLGELQTESATEISRTGCDVEASVSTGDGLILSVCIAPFTRRASLLGRC